MFLSNIKNPFCFLITGGLLAIIISVSVLSFLFVQRTVKKNNAADFANKTIPPQVGMADPAAVYCQEQGGQSQIITAPDGSQTGECLFPDGSKCDEWAFFRHECQKGSKSNFSKEGNYVLIDGRPAFVYEEQGNPAISLYLQFVGETVCDFSQGEGTCNVHQLESGDRVLIEGIKNGDELTIVKMKKI